MPLWETTVWGRRRMPQQTAVVVVEPLLLPLHADCPSGWQVEVPPSSPSSSWSMTKEPPSAAYLEDET